MSTMRALGASVVVASALLAAGQGCALFTCIEDDCASLSSGAGGLGVGGAGPSSASAAMTGTALSATGVGGGGGEAPCVEDCPICSDELDGNALSLAVLDDVVYVVVDTAGPTGLFTISDEPNGFGAPMPLPGDHPAMGQLVATSAAVFHVYGPMFQNVGSGETCLFANPIVAAAAGSFDLYLLNPGALQSFNGSGCSGSPPDDDLDGAVSLAVSPDLVAFDRSPIFSGPCWKPLPIDVNAEPECAPKQETLAVALNPSGKRILFRTATGVSSWEGDRGQPVAPVADFGGEEGALPIAANSSEVFFARANADGHMHRCLYDPPHTCRSAGNGAVTSISVHNETAYFTMGNQVCKWP
jgi:hypothetical protein